MKAPLLNLVAPTDLDPEILNAEYYDPADVEFEHRLRAAHNAAPLGSIASKMYQGASPKGGVKGRSGKPALKVRNLSGYGLDWDVDHVTEQQYAELARARVRSGDVFVIRSAHAREYIGKQCDVFLEDYCPFSVPPLATEELIGARIEDRVSALFATAFLRTSGGYRQIQRRLRGISAKLTPTNFGKVSIPQPDRRVQSHIAAKIELAERCRAASSERWTAATTLLGTALGVPLTPETFEVKSNADVSALGYEVASLRPVVVRVSPERIEASIGAQFFTPRRAKAILVIEQSGFESKRLADLADRFATRVAADELQRQGLAYVGLAQIDSTTGYIAGSADDSPTGTSALFGARDILFSKLRPYLNKVAICPNYLERAAGSTELVTYRTKPGVDPYYVFLVLKSPLVLNQVIDITSGSTHPRVDPDLIDEVLVPLVEPSTQMKIGSSVRSALELMRRATLLVNEAKADVEALIKGNLDIDAIASGRIKPPTAASIAELSEATA